MLNVRACCAATSSLFPQQLGEVVVRVMPTALPSCRRKKQLNYCMHNLQRKHAAGSARCAATSSLFLQQLSERRILGAYRLAQLQEKQAAQLLHAETCDDCMLERLLLQHMHSCAASGTLFLQQLVQVLALDAGRLAQLHETQAAQRRHVQLASCKALHAVLLPAACSSSSWGWCWG
jgi:hypothetical protein